ncbi:hypothetical protein [Planotetraspora phitsanulokensis]|uniref:hypothetical protein n=1 Tax=Planotetraspora phitsanulokensis TaxID=575192 RepID=UPI00194DFD60|nr:hypothetical protein [Planotetraspora phitsanulokensis]
MGDVFPLQFPHTDSQGVRLSTYGTVGVRPRSAITARASASVFFSEPLQERHGP